MTVSYSQPAVAHKIMNLSDVIMAAVLERGKRRDLTGQSHPEIGTTLDGQRSIDCGVQHAFFIFLNAVGTLKLSALSADEAAGFFRTSPLTQSSTARFFESVKPPLTLMRLGRWAGLELVKKLPRNAVSSGRSGFVYLGRTLP